MTKCKKNADKAGCAPTVILNIVCGHTVIYYFCVQVHRFFTKGAASLEGTIKRSDSIFSINGTSLEGKTHGEVMSCLHQSRLSKQALIVIWRNKDSELKISDGKDALQTKNMFFISKKPFAAEVGNA